MWITKDRRQQTLTEPGAELGLMTLGGENAGVALAGERRNLTLCTPFGYHWAPARGDTVLVIKSGPEGAPCVVGQTDQSRTNPGEVYLSVAEGAGIRLTADGGVVITGNVTVNGQPLAGG